MTKVSDMELGKNKEAIHVQPEQPFSLNYTSETSIK